MRTVKEKEKTLLFKCFFLINLYKTVITLFQWQNTWTYFTEHLCSTRAQCGNHRLIALYMFTEVRIVIFGFLNQFQLELLVFASRLSLIHTTCFYNIITSERKLHAVLSYILISYEWNIHILLFLQPAQNNPKTLSSQWQHSIAHTVRRNGYVKINQQ